jgi:hypothetical protein
VGCMDGCFWCSWRNLYDGMLGALVLHTYWWDVGSCSHVVLVDFVRL